MKAAVLTARRPQFDLLETVLYEPKTGYYLLDRHLERLRLSARYFGFRCDIHAIAAELEERTSLLRGGSHRLRLVLSRNGGIRLEHAPLHRPPVGRFRVALSSEPVDSRDPLLFHKTTCRAIYDARLASHPNCDDVVLQNERGEVTECCIGNLVALLDGRKWTPPVMCGLLPGTYRAKLLDQGEIHERVLTPEDLLRAEALFLINSVRRWVQLELLTPNIGLSATCVSAASSCAADRAGGWEPPRPGFLLPKNGWCSGWSGS